MLKTEVKRLNSVHKKIHSLGNVVIGMNKSIFDLLENKDIASIAFVNEKSRSQIQQKADDIDNEVVQIISLYAPNARDLRELVAFLKISNELVRVFTNSYSFIKNFPVAFNAELKHKKIMKFVLPMQEKSLSALNNALSMVDMDDKSEVEETFKLIYTEENQTDDLYQLVEKDIMRLSTSNIELSIEYLEVLSAIRRIEKVADRALNIASLLYFAKIGGEIGNTISTD